MARVLLILVAVGVLLNALTFLLVAHYFSQAGKEPAAAAAATRPTPAEPTPPHPDLLRRLAGLESSLTSLSGKVDRLAARPSPPPPAVTSTGRNPRHPGNAAAPSDEEAAGAVETPPRKEARPESAAPPPAATAEGEKAASPAPAPAEGAAGHPSEPADAAGGTPAPAEPAPQPEGGNG